MTEKTAKIFDAPWKAGRSPIDVVDSYGFWVCECVTHETAYRIVCLPELYDALLEATAGKCWACAGENTETMLDHPCPKGHDEACYVAKWRELLRKVRDGESVPETDKN